MGFGGTTVYFVEMVSADGIPYHKTCFKCSQFNGVLVMGSSLDGVLYCKPHFEQLFRETGSFTKKLANSGEKKAALTKAPSKVSSLFSGTQDKCKSCSKLLLTHWKRCARGGCHITTSNYAALDGILYCKPHFAQFKEKGCYNHVTRTGSKRSGEVPVEDIKAAALEVVVEVEAESTAEEGQEDEKEDEVVAQEQS